MLGFAIQTIMSAKPITLHLAKSKQTLTIDAGNSILDTLLMEGFDVPNSCQEGICGTCETKVLAGTPEHHCQVLSAAERAANQTMMICCSRAVSDELTLDL
jgi:tetrachlorobenzoquinone reductase